MSVISIRAKIEEAGYNVDAFDTGMVEAFRTAVGGLARAAKNEWVRLAQENTATSREIYVNGLMQADSFKSSRMGALLDMYEITLVGKMPNNFEFGMPSFDMKAIRPGWLGGAKAKTAADGHKYAIIPFRHSTSDSPRFNYTGKAKAASDMLRSSGEDDLKQQLRKAVRTYGLDRMVRTATGGVQEGIVRRMPRGAPVHPYLQGMVRTQKQVSGTTKGGARGQGKLMTFRVMSEKSKPGSWIHPGLEGLNLLPEVESFIDSQIGNIIEQIVGV